MQENATAVTTITAAGGTTPYVFTLNGGADAAKFNLAGTGQLTFKTAPDFEAPTDADGNNVYLVNVKATDAGGMVATQSLTVTVTDVASETIPPPLDIDFTTGTLDPKITFARAGSATYYGVDGLLKTAATGAPRFDYDPVAHTPRGLLLEEQRTNYAQASETFNSAAWSLVNTSVTADATTAPDGTTTADRLTATSTVTVDAIIYQATAVPTAGTAVFMGAFYAKKNVGDWVVLRPQCGGVLPYAWFNLNTGTVGTVQAGIIGAKIENVGNGWYRISAGLAGSNGATRFYSIGLADADNTTACTSGNSAYIWGAQVEEGSFATSYIPTTAAAVTRAADLAVMTGTNFSSWYNASEGTFVADYRPQSVTGTQPVISVNDNTANEAIQLYGSGTDPKATIVDGGVTQADLDAGTVAANTFYKLGLAYKLNDFGACLDGGTVATDATGTLPTVTQLLYGADTSNVSNLHVRRISFYNTRKTNAELQALTT